MSDHPSKLYTPSNGEAPMTGTSQRQPLSSITHSINHPQTHPQLMPAAPSSSGTLMVQHPQQRLNPQLQQQPSSLSQHSPRSPHLHRRAINTSPSHPQSAPTARPSTYPPHHRLHQLSRSNPLVPSPLGRSVASMPAPPGAQVNPQQYMNFNPYNLPSASFQHEVPVAHTYYAPLHPHPQPPTPAQNVMPVRPASTPKPGHSYNAVATTSSLPTPARGSNATLPSHTILQSPLLPRNGNAGATFNDRLPSYMSEEEKKKVTPGMYGCFFVDKPVKRPAEDAEEDAASKRRKVEGGSEGVVRQGDSSPSVNGPPTPTFSLAVASSAPPTSSTPGTPVIFGGNDRRLQSYSYNFAFPAGTPPPHPSPAPAVFSASSDVGGCVSGISTPAAVAAGEPAEYPYAGGSAIDDDLYEQIIDSALRTSEDDFRRLQDYLARQPLSVWEEYFRVLGWPIPQPQPKN